MGGISKSNWLDELRLLFASLVIFSHSFELTLGKGNPIAQPFGTWTLGELAVCAFFILSGYLISRSWLTNPDPGAYLRNRLLRIVPAFVVAFAVSVLVVGALGAPDAGAYYRALDWPRLATQIALLDQPATPPTFLGSRDPQVNGAMWTIQLEFLCYLIAPFAVYRWSTLAPLWLLAVAVTLLTNSEFARFLLMFLSGAAFWCFRLRPNRWAVAVSVAVLPVALVFPAAWPLGLGTAGAYLLLCLGLFASPLRLPDLSYGTYLYGWPIQMTLIAAGLTNPWLLFPTALSLALICGGASWFGIERFAIRLKARVGRGSARGAGVSNPIIGDRSSGGLHRP